MAGKDEWQEKRLEVLRGLKSPTEHQRLLLDLAATPSPTADETRKLDALWKAERAEVRARDLRGVAARIVDEEKRAARKARDHELYESAGLLILAGLVDTKTGKPNINPAELLGALAGLAKVSADDPRRSEWKRAGESLFTERTKAKAKAKATEPGPTP
jgi:hypothetical protein